MEIWKPAFGTRYNTHLSRDASSDNYRVLPDSCFGFWPCQVSSMQSAWWQIWVLSVRFSRTWWRDPILISDFLFQYCFAGIFIGEQDRISDFRVSNFRSKSASWGCTVTERDASLGATSKFPKFYFCGAFRTKNWMWNVPTSLALK